MPDDQSPVKSAGLVLRLKPTVPTELIRPRQKIKQPDGPWIANPDLIDDLDRFNVYQPEGMVFAPDITMDDYRNLWKADQAEQIKKPRGCLEDFEILSVLDLWPSIDMQKIQNMTDSEIAKTIERHYVGAHHYLRPGFFASASLIDRFGDDWRMNARGIYYRHYYSPGWVTADHNLWLPSLNDIDWDNYAEEGRRTRAKSFLKHALDNERWSKSEYAWEADAWADVFDGMRNDPVLSVDKHEYNTIGSLSHPASCLLTGESKFIKRIPDATFGLTTFQPRDYQNALAEWDLDRDRLEAILLHRQCGLISDPRWGQTSLAFPFAVYEAKGWSGDARVARRQACAAGRVYLDMLDNLTRQPGKTRGKKVVYQTDQSHGGQVFVFTSFGAHWHILVGYKRPRLKREHAGVPGVSEAVYVFQRIWSSRVTTERKAWELLTLVDQIHLWGATEFRDFVIQHLRPWHEFGRKCYINDISFTNTVPGAGKKIVDGKPTLGVPSPCLQLPEWTEHFVEDARLKFKERAVFHLRETYTTYKMARAIEFPDFRACLLDGCGSLEDPGYPMATTEDCVMHLREVHGTDDAEIAQIEHAWETKDCVRLSRPPYNGHPQVDMPLPRGTRKRRSVDISSEVEQSKRRRR